MAAHLAPLDALDGSMAAHLTRLDALAGGEPRALALGWPELDGVLPDGGLPRGVVELASYRALGGPARIAAQAVRAAQAADPRAWCAWIDPEGTLYAPGLAAAGVDLGRLLVARPPAANVARVAVKIAQARAFEVLVVDAEAIDEGGRRRGWRGDVVVRKLALLAEEGGAAVLLLTDARARRALPWPVALRLEITRASPDAFAVRVAKDRRGRVGLARTVPLEGARAVRSAEAG